MFKGKTIGLILAEQKDAGFIYKCVCNDKVWCRLTADPAQLNQTGVVGLLSRSSTGMAKVFLIVDLATEHYVGVITLNDIDLIDRSCTVGNLCINYAEATGIPKDAGKLAIKLMLKYGFTVLGMHRIGCVVWQDNPFKKLLKRMGIKLEGILRDASFRNGTYTSKMLFGVTDMEYKELSKQWLDQ